MPANQLTGFTYSFQCISDEVSPYVSDIEPQPFSMNNPINTNVSFHINDEGFGVDINSVVVDVQDVIYSISNANLFYSGSTNDYLIVIDPESDFNSGDTVHVSIDASDLAIPTNQMGTYTYSFECEIVDIYPPFIWQPSPSDGSIDVSIYTDIQCYILDSGSDVDSTSIEMKINNIDIIDFSIEAISILGSAGFLISYQPLLPFEHNENVTVIISATDLAIIPNSLIDASFSFTCEENQAPTIILPDDLSCEEDNYIIENFSFYINDPENDIPILEAPVTNNLTITIDGYMVVVEPDHNWFGLENVTFNILDIEGIIIASDSVDIIVSSINDMPLFDLNQFPEHITFIENTEKIIDFSDMIIDPEQSLEELSFYISGNENIEVSLSDFIVTFSAPENWTGSEMLTFTLEDNVSRVSYSKDAIVNVIAEIPDEKIIIEPHTVRWNEDCIISIYSQVELNKISGKILNRNGKLIKNLTIINYGNNKQATWDKTDTGYNLVSGGFYIYQIKVKDRIYQGSIIIAR